MNIGELMFHSLRRFELLWEFQNTLELYGFSPCIHSAAAGMQELLAAYVRWDKLFPGGHGLKINTVGKNSYKRQVMVVGGDFNNALLPTRLCQFRRSLYLCC